MFGQVGDILHPGVGPIERVVGRVGPQKIGQGNDSFIAQALFGVIDKLVGKIGVCRAKAGHFINDNFDIQPVAGLE